MDSKKDMEEYQGRQVFLSQLLDWDSLNYQLVIPLNKTEIFRTYCNILDDDVKPYPIIIIFGKNEYKGNVLEFWNSSRTEYIINIVYSCQLSIALQNTFKDLYQQFSFRKKGIDVKDIEIPIIKLLSTNYSNVFELTYNISESKQSNLDEENYALQRLRNNVSHNLDVSEVKITNESSLNILSLSEKKKVIKYFSFKDDIPSLCNTKPVYFFYKSQQHEVSNWSEFVVLIAKIVCKQFFGYRLKKALPSDYNFTTKKY